MIVAVDGSIVYYCLKYLLACDNSGEVSFVCKRLEECVHRIDLTMTVMLIEMINDYLEKNDPEYLKLSPIKSLLASLTTHRKVFRK